MPGYFPHVKMARWQEIEQADKENRHELVLSGADISSRIESKGIDPCLFKLKNINFLEISKTSLTAIPQEIGELSNLTNLVLCLNKITEVPASIGKLQKLKLLNLSRNEIESLPEEIGQLESVQSFNITGNKLTDFPDVSGMLLLHHLDVSYNELESLPPGIPCTELLHLAEIRANNNKLKELPEELGTLPALKVFDVSENSLTQIPADLCECTKIKELHFTGNKLKDRKLGRMGDQVKIKAIFDYLFGILQKERQGGKGKGGKKGKSKRKKEKSVSEDLCSNFMKVLHFEGETSKSVEIMSMPSVQNVRPFVVACVVRHLNFCKSKNMYKRFIALQTKLHDTVCNKRQAATIATHDLAAVKAPLVYEARPQQTMMLRPLFKQKDISAERLVSKLRQEAEELRKEKKRNTISGIHKYLDLLKGKTEYPCLVDSDGTIISFPPITNCDVTKISRTTTDLLIEVTSSSSLDTCKKVMHELLQAMLEMGVGQEEAPTVQASADEADEEQDEGAAGGGDGGQEMSLTTDQCLVVEQVKVTNEEGTLKVVYPSRVDLVSEAFRIVRDG